MAIPLLPAPLGRVAIPLLLSPSRLGDLERCPLMVLGEGGVRADAMLPPSPEALFGSMLHHVRQQLLEGHWGEARTPQEAAESVLECVSEHLDGLLCKTQGLERLAPLREVIGRATWNTRRHEMRLWAQALRQQPTGLAPAPMAVARGHRPRCRAPSEDRLEFGSEARVTCNALRLDGRADRIDRLPGGSVEVIEYKTGPIAGPDGEILDRHAGQVRLYALCIEALDPGLRARPFVERGARHAVAWAPDDKRRSRRLLEALHERFPAEEERSPEDLARPGVACRSCRLRSACPSYQLAAPAWWSSGESLPWTLPFDLFGTVTRRTARKDATDLELRDRAGRLVSVEGLDSAHGAEEIAVGDDIFFFNLEPTEPTALHGVRLHPRSFHDLPPDGGRSMRRAHSLQVFRR